MKTQLTAVALAFASSAAFGQLSGVSHPEQVPVSTSPEGISQPVVYETPAGYVLTPPTLKTRVPAPAAAVSAAEPVYTATVAPVAPHAIDTKAVTLSDVDAGIVTRVTGPTNQLPVGTLVKTKTVEDLSTKATAAGTIFTASLTEAVERDGRVLLPVGSVITGKVTEIHGGRRISGAASMHLQPSTITLPDGTRYAVRGQVIDTGEFHATKVDKEGTILRRDHAGKTLAGVGLSTGSGAAAGAVLGGWPGALIGAGVGAGVSTVVWLKQDRQTNLPVGTPVTFSLISPMTVGMQ